MISTAAARALSFLRSPQGRAIARSAALGLKDLASGSVQDHLRSKIGDALQQRFIAGKPKWVSSVQSSIPTTARLNIAQDSAGALGQKTKMMLQLNPMIPFWHAPTGQACHAFMAIDYSQEHDLMFTVIMQDTGEIWVCRALDLRGQENITLGRSRQHKQTKDANMTPLDDHQP